MKNTIYLLVVLQGFMLPLTSIAKDKTANALNQQVPTLFIENKGQITDQNHARRNDIDYKVSATKGLNVFIGAGAIHYQFSKANETAEQLARVRKRYPEEAKPVSTTYSMYRMDVELVNANKDARVLTGMEQRYTENYFLPESDNSGTTVHSYNTITYVDVYPHIDWVINTRDGKLKHEFVVHKGGNPGDIKIKYSGANGLSLNEKGALVANTPQGAITETAPYSYQSDKKEVKSSFNLEGDVISYEMGSFEGDLVIDPDLAWATFYGGTGSEYGLSVATDATGNAFMTGYTSSTDNMVTAGAYDISFAGSYIAFLVKFNKDGVRQWGTYYGGGDEIGYGVATDNSGNVYMCGQTSSSSGIATAGAFNSTALGAADGFLVKFNSAGVRQWGTYIGGTSDEFAFTTSTDASGNVYVTGQTNSTTGIATAGVFQTSLVGGDNAFLMKFNTSGTRLWGTYVGSGYSTGGGIAIDASGNVHLSGFTQGTSGIASSGAYQTVLGGTSDCYLIKFNSSGARIWGTLYGGEVDEQNGRIVLDGSGNVYLAGITTSFSNIASTGAYQTAIFGSLPFANSDFFLAKFNSSGVRQWGTYYGKGGVESYPSLKIDPFGFIYISGTSTSDTGMSTSDGIQTRFGGGSDIVVAKFNSSGARTWATYYGNANNETCHWSAFDVNGNQFLVGNANGSDIGTDFTTSQCHQAMLTGSEDGFLIKIASNMTPIVGGTSQLCLASSITLTNATSGGTWSSDDVSVAIIGSSSGIITGVAQGYTTITYMHVTGMYTTKRIYVGYPQITTVVGNGTAGNTGDGAAATAAKINTPVAVHVDAAGNIYTVSDNKIRKVNTSGNISTIAGTGVSGFFGDAGQATAAKINSVTGIATDAAGNVYIVDAGNNRVRRISTAGVITTIAGNGSYTSAGDGSPATAAGLNNPYGIAIDAAGNKYITEKDGQRVRKINTSGIISTVAGNGTAGFAVDGGPATATTLYEPKAIAVSAAGELYIADYSNARIRKVSTAGIITTVAGTSLGGATEDGIPATDATLGYPVGVAVDAANNIYISNDYENRVRKVDTSGMINTYACGDAGVPGYRGDNGPAILARANGLQGICLDAGGNLYMADAGNNRIRKVHACGTAPVAPIIGTRNICTGSTAVFSSATTGGTWSSSSTSVATINSTSGFVTGISTGSAIITYMVAGSYALSKIYVGMSALSNVTADLTGANDGDGGTATDAHVHFPTGLTRDTSGNIYFASKDVIRKINPAGVITTVAGTEGSSGDGGDGGYATAATLYNPTGVAVDGAGNIYIADRQNNRIRKVNTSGVISTILGDGSYSESGDGGLAIFATCAYPSGIAADVAGNVYFVDQGAGRVRKINTSGIVSTVAGNGVYGFSGDGGPATAAMLNQPFGVHIDASGNLFIADRTNHRIRKVNTSGIISTVAGNGDAGYAGDGVAATATSLNTPLSVSTDAAGNIYIADASNYRIRKVSTGGTMSTIAGNGIGGYSGIGGMPAEAEIASCWGVLVDTSGTVYFSEMEANTVAKITSCHVVTELTPITGTATACIGTTTTLNCTTTGGTWTSGSTSTATVGASSGVVLGVAAGTVDISYTTGTDVRVKTVTINALPAAITGTLNACVGATTALADATTGGTWSSGGTSVATVGSTTGVVTGVAAGTVNISYTGSNGCSISAVTTIQPNPAAITGTPTSICVGATTTLNCTTTGGTWSSGSTGVGTVGSSTGIVTGVASGVTSISYILPTGCRSTANITVNPNPAAITGTTNVCVSATTTLATTTTGGAWISSSTSTATVGASTGIVTGIAAGTSSISYAISATGCYTTAVVTVNPLPAAITGTLSVCAGSTTTLSSTTSGATWSSGTTSVATIGSTGIVTGVAAGTSSVSYTTSFGCRVLATVTVNPLPLAITGTTSVCEAATATLADATTGGAWSSSATGTATVGSTTGIVSGVLAGTSTISYILTATGCYATATATVNPLPAAITGASTVCTGAVASLSDVTSGGVWSSSSSATATVGSSSGIVNGVAPGTVNITYTLPITGCKVVSTMTVNLTPSAITGTAVVCEGASTILSSTPTGGTWSSSATAIGTVGTTGIVSGLTAGTTTIIYTLSTGCNTSQVYTVNPLPLAITGTLNVCMGSTTTLADATTGGTWTSGATGVATVFPSTGVVSGVTAGSANITYTLSTGCYRSAVMTVNPLPAAITGTANVCVGATTTLNNATSGGTWSSVATGIATIGASTGIVTGVTAGTALMSYTLGTGCAMFTVVTVNPLPAAITGINRVCLGSTTNLSSATGGGTWSSSASGIVDVNSSGVASGISIGSATISYRLSTGCFDTIVVSTDTVPTIAVTGPNYVCIGTPATYTSSMTGGTWTSSNTSLATVTTAGVVSGVASGVVDISYLYANICGVFSSAKNIHVYTPAQCDSVTGTGIVTVASQPIELFPNPNMGNFSVIVHAEMDEKLTITIYNQLGQKVWEGNGVSNSTLHISTNFAPGIYTLMAQNQYRSHVVKFVNMREQ